MSSALLDAHRTQKAVSTLRTQVLTEKVKTAKAKLKCNPTHRMSDRTTQQPGATLQQIKKVSLLQKDETNIRTRLNAQDTAVNLCVFYEPVLSVVARES